MNAQRPWRTKTHCSLVTFVLQIVFSVFHMTHPSSILWHLLATKVQLLCRMKFWTECHAGLLQELSLHLENSGFCEYCTLQASQRTSVTGYESGFVFLFCFLLVFLFFLPHSGKITVTLTSPFNITWKCKATSPSVKHAVSKAKEGERISDAFGILSS